jgi:predicted nucleotidyltransferase
MAGTPQNGFPFPPLRHYEAPDIPMGVIRRYVRAIAEKFHPDKIILFGSFAYGTPHEDSDVDLLVIVPARHQGARASRIQLALCAPFALDLIVRTPETMQWRLAEGDSFLLEIVLKGKVLYQKANGISGFSSPRTQYPPSRCSRPRRARAGPARASPASGPPS